MSGIDRLLQYRIGDHDTARSDLSEKLQSSRVAQEHERGRVDDEHVRHS